MPKNKVNNNIKLKSGGGILNSANGLSVDTGTTDGKIVAMTTGDKLPAVDGSQLTGIPTFTNTVSISASDNLKYSSDAEKINSGSTDNTYRLQKQFTIYRNGVIRVKFDAKPHNTYETCYAQIFINGAPAGTEQNLYQTSGPDYITYSNDLSVKLGDKIELWTKRASTRVYVKNYRLYFDRNITADVVSNLD